MELKLYQVDAFASRVFQGNPAAVCPLDEWLADETMQKIAEENNLSETAFFVRQSEGVYALRWFTPVAEVDLCGHATLAAAHVLYKHYSCNTPFISFETRSGPLTVEKTDSGYRMKFPASPPEKITPPEKLIEALGVMPRETLLAFDYIVVLDSESELQSLEPDLMLLADLNARGVVVTAPGDDVDFVSRCFFPKLRVNEDPVTGSAHCELAPYWSRRSGLHRFNARQLSKRSGLIDCEVVDNSVFLTGNAVDYLQGKIFINNET